MKILELDWETYGSVDLRGEDSVGVYNYASHQDTEILMGGYKLPDETERKLWFPHLGEMPLGLRAALLDPTVKILSYNSAFERYILQFQCGITLSPSRFIDPQVCSRVLSMPGKLETDCYILNVPNHLAKSSRGEELIKLFCMPQPDRKKRGQAQTYHRKDWNTHPAEWAEFGEYCKQDLVAEAELWRRQTILGAWPLSEFEQKLWEFDQLVNDRGLPVDVEFVKKAYALATRSKQEALALQNFITGLENANSRDQLLPWVKQRGYPFNTLRGDTVKSVLKDPEVTLTEDCRTVLKARTEAASTSYQKLAAILRQVCDDGYLRGQFIYLGSPRCGRWAGNAVQLHNMARPLVLGRTAENPDGYDFEKEEVLREARALVNGEQYDEIKARYGSVLLTIKCLIRTAFSVEHE